MVMARLHIICGNCGCNDMFKFHITKNGNDHGDGTFSDSVCIACGNCKTLHFLDSVIPRESD